MTEKSRGFLFRKRNVLGAALVAGIGVGMYLGKLPGIGSGGSGFFGFGHPTGETTVSTKTDGEEKPRKELPDAPEATADVLRVVIDEHQYLLKSEGKETPIKLADLIERIKQTPGDSDGVRLKIFQKETARVKAEEDLKSALSEAQIADTAVLWFSSNPTK